MIIEKVKSINSLPREIEKAIKGRKDEEFYDMFFHEKDLYIVASLGQKNTLGYEINIRGIKEIGLGNWEVRMEKKEPKKGQILGQAITTPLTIAKIMIRGKEEISPEKITFRDIGGELIKGISLKSR